MSDSNIVELAAELTAAWLSNPSTRAEAEDVKLFLTAMNATLTGLASSADGGADEPAGADHLPAVSVRKSLASREHIVSMIDGRPYRTLKRHLATHGLTPDAYRQRYNLKADYPMVAPGYSEARSATAKRLGLGRKPAPAAAEAERTAKPARKPRRRGGAGDTKAAEANPGD